MRIYLQACPADFPTQCACLVTPFKRQVFSFRWIQLFVPGMDGLAMALWALWNSNTFSTALQKAVNLLGDADTVAC